jgi:hypothetical protein
MWGRSLSHLPPDELVFLDSCQGKDFGVLELDVMILVDPVFSQCEFVGLPKPDLLVVRLHPGLTGTTRISNVNMATQGMLYLLILLSPRSSYRTDEARDLHGWQADTLDIMPGHYSSYVAAGGEDIWKEGGRDWLLPGLGGSCRWINPWAPNVMYTHYTM